MTYTFQAGDAASRGPGPGAESSRDQSQPFMLGEVLKVLHVQGRQRQAMYEAAGGDPGVVG